MFHVFKSHQIKINQNDSIYQIVPTGARTNKKEYNTDQKKLILPNMEASIKKPVLFQDSFMALLLFK